MLPVAIIIAVADNREAGRPARFAAAVERALTAYLPPSSEFTCEAVTAAALPEVMAAAKPDSRHLFLVNAGGDAAHAGEHAGLNLHYIDAAPEAAALAARLADEIEASLPEIYRHGEAPRQAPAAIEDESMTRLDALLDGADNSNAEYRIRRRLAHASGDADIARRVRFHPAALSAAAEAFSRGAPVFTDSRMTAAGINRDLMAEFGCVITCALAADDLADFARETGITRSAAAFRLLGKRLNEAIVAVGNAPTALREVLRLTGEENIRPALIVGLPVGFVQAREAKMALADGDVPYITLRGTRGGSALAAAAINALATLNRPGREGD